MKGMLLTVFETALAVVGVSLFQDCHVFLSGVFLGLALGLSYMDGARGWSR